MPYRPEELRYSTLAHGIARGNNTPGELLNATHYEFFFQVKYMGPSFVAEIRLVIKPARGLILA